MLTYPVSYVANIPILQEDLFFSLSNEFRMSYLWSFKAPSTKGNLGNFDTCQFATSSTVSNPGGRASGFVIRPMGRLPSGSTALL